MKTNFACVQTFGKFEFYTFKAVDRSETYFQGVDDLPTASFLLVTYHLLVLLVLLLIKTDIKEYIK